MATEILLPQWGMEMQDGTVVKWLKQEGDTVQEGEPIVEVETAKIQTELESSASGVLVHIMVAEGTIVPIRALLAIVADPGEEVPRPAATTPSKSPPSPAGGGGVPAPPSTQPAAPRVAAPGAPTPGVDGDRVQVVPAARRLAQERGVDLSRVQGTGPRGRVLIADVERAIEERTSPAVQPIAMVGIRRTIATRMMQSLQTMAQVTLTTEADMADAMVLRSGLSRQWTEQSLSPLHLAVKAAARALKDHPRLNSLQEEDQAQPMQEVNIGVAVSLEEGLITPVIHNADQKSLAQISSQARALAAKTREGKARPEDVTGGTFTISNLGAYGVDAFTPIINPPQVAILGLGRVVEKPVIRNGEIAKGAMMFLSLTFDHRVVDGAPAAEFLQTLKGYLEEPWWMVA